MKEIEKNLPIPLIAWYDFAPHGEVLFIKGDTACDGIENYLREKKMAVSSVTPAQMPLEGNYDYIVAAGILERSAAPEILLEKIHSLIAPDGIVLIGTENRLGIRYFCGDKDSFSGQVLDGLDNYVQVTARQKKKLKGRMYSHSELEQMFRKAGFERIKSYSVMPTLIRPQLFLADGRRPNEDLGERIAPEYHNPNTVFLDEKHLYAALLENEMFHPMANAYLFECTKNGALSAYDQVTVQADRAPGEAMATLVIKDREVYKKALYPQATGKIQAFMEKQQDLQKHHVPIVEAKISGDTYVEPYVNGKIATAYFQELLKKNKDSFLNELTDFFRIVLNSSEHVPYGDVNWKCFEPYWEERKPDDPNIDKWERAAFGTAEEKKNIGVILKYGYIELVSLNCFHTEKGFLFFDQEFYIENFPANAILMRTIDFIYKNRRDLEALYPQDEVLKYFSLYEYRDTWRAKSDEFLGKLMHAKELSVYHRCHRSAEKIRLLNRFRMNYPQDEYERLFTNIFKNIENKKIYLFGAGRYAEQFLEQFGKYITIFGVLDNNESKWGKDLNGILISKPSILEKEDAPYKVFICMKNYEEVLAQLKEMRVKNCSVYNPRLVYEHPVKVAETQQGKCVSKPYHIGYVAGVFDLFHIGHLNLLRRAKEQCDYLIAGVVSDEQVIRGKKTSPCIPFEERFEIVRACRYVDEAVKIPPECPDTEDAWYMYQFDAQFSGSDYSDDPVWAQKREFLRQHGAELVFFPYTESTSSTKIKEMINRKLV